jgi:LPS export ABC transporter permease LptG/LPS export ABC transporter permease LptF
MRTLDRYLVRETSGPFLLALSLFTFLFGIRPMLDYASDLLAKGVGMGTVGLMLLDLVPQALGITLPMAFLTGVLIALGRLSADREAVALLALGISPWRLLRPVLALGAVVLLADLYVMIEAIPNRNQAFRERAYSLLQQTTERDIRPGLFFEKFPNKVLRVQDVGPGGRWTGVFLADTSRQARPPVVTVAESGQVEFDPERKAVRFVLSGARRYDPGVQTGVYDVAVSTDPVLMTVAASEVFGGGTILPGLNELGMSELRERIKQDRARGGTARNEVMTLHQKFSFPVACLVFGICAVAAGVHTRREGRMGGLAVGLAVIAIYYAVMQIAESAVKGNLLSPAWSRWVPNLVVGGAGLLAIARRSRRPGAELFGSAASPGWWRRPLQTRHPRSRPEAVASGSTGPLREPTSAGTIPPRLLVFRARLLDAYVSRRYLRLMSLSFLGLLTLFYVGTAVDFSDKLLKGQASGRMLAEYLLYSTPQFIVYVLPMATLVSVLATIGGLARSSELTVMRACGISLYRAAAPLALFAVVWAGALFLVQDRVLGPSSRHAEDLDTTMRTGQPPIRFNAWENRQWLGAEGGRVFYYRHFAPGVRPTVVDLSRFTIASGPYRLVEHTYVDEASFVDGAWIARSGWTQSFEEAAAPASAVSLAGRPIDVVNPDRFGSGELDVAMMTFGELRAHIAQLAESGFSVADERVQLQSRMAYPAVVLVMTVLGIPFGLISGRYGALYSVGLAIGIACLQLLLTFFFNSTGSAGVLPAALAAWATNILFLAAAGYLLLTVRT